MADLRKLNWGILGTGNIAKKFASGVNTCANGTLVATGSRSAEAASKFASEFGGAGHGSYDGVLSDPSVEAVYISLPHHMHAEWIIKCARAGKHILCEKPFTLSLSQTQAALKEVRAADVFCMEAFMYRCHPQTATLLDLIKGGVIGQPMIMNVQFGYRTARNPEAFRMNGAYGGGALMDVGCYCTSLARLVAGQDPKKLNFSAKLDENGYDHYGTGELIFENEFRATFATGIHCTLDNAAVIYGELGKIIITSPWFCNGPLYVQLEGKEPEQIKVKQVADLWGNQAGVVSAFLDQKQAGFVSWNDTLGNAMTLDGCRKMAGMTIFDEPLNF